MRLRFSVVLRSDKLLMRPPCHHQEEPNTTTRCSRHAILLGISTLRSPQGYGFALGAHLHLNRHAEIIGRRSAPAAGQRNRIRRITCNRDPDEIAVPYDAVGGVELDPTGARQIDLAP